MPAIEVRDLRKRYRALEAVRGITFAIEPGEIVGLLGPNGAGKTTTLECVTGLRRPDSGEIRICGVDVRTDARAVRGRIGVQLQATALPDRIGTREALRFFAACYPRHADVDALIARFGLAAFADARVDRLSGGQQQRLALALALVNEPEVVLLDEPTAALDPHARRALHAEILAMKAAGRAVVLCTHHIDEAESLCDRVLIVDRGLVIAQGTPRELVERARSPVRLIVRAQRPLDAAALRALPGVDAVEAADGGWSIAAARMNPALLALAQLLAETDNPVVDLRIARPTLEDVFVELTGRSFAGDPAGAVERHPPQAGDAARGAS